MKIVRRISQLLFLLLFFLLFFQTVHKINWTDGSMTVSAWLPADFFLRINPLLGWTSMVSAGSFLLNVALWTIPVLVLTLLFGRVFCGWICPLGTCIDGTDRLIRGKKDRRTNREKSWPRVKYYILAGLLMTTILGSQLVWVLDPIALFFRSLTIGILGPLHWLSTSVSGMPVLGWVSAQSSGLFFEQQTVFRSGFIALLMLGGIFAAGMLSRRFWCRTLCPLGALLGGISKLSLVHRRVAKECNECRLCSMDCKMDAIGETGKSTNPAECVFCYSCDSLCRQRAVRMAPGISDPLPLDLNRRRLLAGIGIGALWGLSGKSAVAMRPVRDGSSNITSKYLIRPPGSSAEKLFTERCIRCGACMKICPTNGLQPALTEGGLGGIWTPVLVPRIGECSQNCNLCGQVCPTLAIEPFTIPEKEHLFIGRAVINRSTCVVWESDKECLVCDEVCSFSAIYWVDENGQPVHAGHEDGTTGELESSHKGMPHVDPARCIGCGICEYNCPVGGPDAAIRVTGDGDKRFMSREEQKAWQITNWVEREDKPSL
jgi:polyferredoxin